MRFHSPALFLSTPTPPKGEIDEMVELYKEKGFEEEDARQIMTLMRFASLLG